MMFYRVRPTCLGGFFTCLENILAENLEAQRSALGLK